MKYSVKKHNNPRIDINPKQTKKSAAKQTNTGKINFLNAELEIATDRIHTQDAELEKSAKLSAIGLLSSQIAHDLRSPPIHNRIITVAT